MKIDKKDYGIIIIGTILGMIFTQKSITNSMDFRSNIFSA